MTRPSARGLKTSYSAEDSWQIDGSKISIRGGSLSALADFIEEQTAGIPVIAQQGLSNNYDLDLFWGQTGPGGRIPQRPELDQLLLDQLGLELVSTNLPVKMLVIDRVKAAK
jgi:uncharacterized protein (TIGR03435 family)